MRLQHLDPVRYCCPFADSCSIVARCAWFASTSGATASVVLGFAGTSSLVVAFFYFCVHLATARRLQMVNGNPRRSPACQQQSVIKCTLGAWLQWNTDHNNLPHPKIKIKPLPAACLLLETVGCVARAALHFGTLEARRCSIHRTTCWPRKRHLCLLDPRTPCGQL